MSFTCDLYISTPDRRAVIMNANEASIHESMWTFRSDDGACIGNIDLGVVGEGISTWYFYLKVRRCGGSSVISDVDDLTVFEMECEVLISIK